VQWKGRDIKTDKWMATIRLRSASQGWQRYGVQWIVNTVRWRSAGGISARDCYFADNQRPRLKLTLERVGGRIVRTRKWDGEHVALRLPTGQCRTGQGNCPTELVLWSPGSSCVSSTNSAEAVYASNSSRFNDHAANSTVKRKRLSLSRPALYFIHAFARGLIVRSDNDE